MIEDMIELLAEIVGNGMHDDEAGSTNGGMHVARIGRRLLLTDERGFRDYIRCETEAEAEAEMIAAADYGFDAHDDDDN